MQRTDRFSLNTHMKVHKYLSNWLSPCRICRNRARLNCLLIVLGGLWLETTETARDHCRLHIQYTKRPLPPKCVKEGVKTIWMAWEEVNCVLTAMVVHGVHTIYHSLASPESLISGLSLSGIYPLGRNELFQIFTRSSTSIMSVTQNHFYSINTRHSMSLYCLNTLHGIVHIIASILQCCIAIA